MTTTAPAPVHATATANRAAPASGPATGGGWHGRGWTLPIGPRGAWPRIGRGVTLLALGVGLGLGLLLSLLTGCGGRAAGWSAPDPQPSGTDPASGAFGLAGAVALMDAPAERVLLLTTDVDLNAYVQPVPIDRQVRAVALAPDRSKLFVVSAGDSGERPPDGKSAETPALTVVTASPPGTRRFPLSEPFTGLALDPQGRWAVVYADSASAAFVSNPNELLLIDLEADPAAGNNPHSLVLRSFGGRPQRFTFTDVLELPGGKRRLLIVETEQDVALVDLSHLELPEITIQLTSAEDTTRVQPAGVDVTDGDPGPDDARIAIRLAGDSSVVIATLAAATARDFLPEINLVDVGGVASDAAFVRTDNGALALAALIPARNAATLVDPDTGVTIDVPLPAPYQNLSLITASTAATTTTTTTTTAATTGAADVALLWSASSAGGVAFWELGQTAGQPYRAAETVGVTSTITDVIDVGGAHPELKLLRTPQNQFYLLDLSTREASPFQTRDASVSLTVSVRGDRAWAFTPGSTDLAAVDLATQHPEQMDVDRPIGGLFDIEATHADVHGTAAPAEPDAARSLVVWNPAGNGGVTIYDARATGTADAASSPTAATPPPISRRRNVSALLLEDLDAPTP
jgi:hypothetical protein